MPFSTNITPYRTVDSSLTALTRKAEQTFRFTNAFALLAPNGNHQIWTHFPTAALQAQSSVQSLPQDSGWLTDTDASLPGWRMTFALTRFKLIIQLAHNTRRLAPN
jgi:hypothetical protein